MKKEFNINLRNNVQSILCIISIIIFAIRATNVNGISSLSLLSAIDNLYLYRSNFIAQV